MDFKAWTQAHLTEQKDNLEPLNNPPVPMRGAKMADRNSPADLVSSLIDAAWRILRVAF